MSKLIGIITAVYVEDWIEPAIKQALEYCDEVVVSVGAHSTAMQSLQDKTLERAQKYDKVVLVPPVTAGAIVGGRWKTLNRMVEASSAEVGDWLWMIDADEFYFPNTVDRIRETIKQPGIATVSIDSKFFFINMTRHVRAKHVRLYKMTHEGVHYTRSGAQTWNGRGERTTIGMTDDPTFGMFHYSVLVSPKYKRLQWDSEFGQTTGRVREIQNKKLQWLENIWLPFELDNEDYWIDKNTELLGLRIRTPLWTPSFPPDSNGNLYQYDGPHPSFIEEAELHLVEDFRTFYNDR